MSLSRVERSSLIPLPRLSERVKSALASGLFWSGACAARIRLGLSRPDAATILLYHSVAPPEAGQWIDPRNTLESTVFERQMSMLARSSRVISLGELAGRLKDGRTLGGSVVITFDDGYLDNLTVATPVLARFKLPATLFLPTGHIDRGEPQWVDHLFASFSTATGDRLTLPGRGTWVMSKPTETREAYARCCALLIVASLAERGRLLAEIDRQIKPATGTNDRPRTVMTWDEVRRLRDLHAGWTLGVHSADHLDMSAIDESEAGRQVSGCVSQFKAELGAAPRHFSFPYGRSTARTRELVRESGLESGAASGGPPTIRPGADPFWLPRHVVGASMTTFRIRASPGSAQMVDTLLGPR